MFELQANNILKEFYENEHFFTQEDFLYFADSPDSKKILEDAFTHDSEFIALLNGDLQKKYFISKKTLIKWYLRLSLRLSKEKTFRLNQNQLTALFSFLFVDDRFKYPPSQLVAFGKHYGFIEEIPGKNRQYIFPIAHILSYINYAKSSLAINKILEEISLNKTIKNINFKYLCKIFVKKGLSYLKIRENYIIRSREELIDGKKVTLDKIGKIIGITRERVRQIEKKAWIKLNHHTNSSLFTASLICQIINKQGSLLFSENSPDSYFVKFLAKSSNVPISYLNINKIILGKIDDDIYKLGFQLIDDIKYQTVLDWLTSKENICLIKKDLQNLSKCMSNYYKEKLTKEQKVYLALKKIGKPAHFSRIAIAYNSIFINNPSTEHNIHAVLTRKNNGIVNIGIRGTYALKEWGYEKPLLTLFETVRKIVKKNIMRQASLYLLTLSLLKWGDIGG